MKACIHAICGEVSAGLFERACQTQHGAEVADRYLTLIHTCELNQVNPFDYLLQLLRHASDAAADPGAWLPWNFHLQLRGP